MLLPLLLNLDMFGDPGPVDPAPTDPPNALVWTKSEDVPIALVWTKSDAVPIALTWTKDLQEAA